MNHELPDVQADLEKAEEPEIKWAISTGSQKKQENQRKTFVSLTTTKDFDCVGHLKLWKILKVMGIPDYPTFTLRNLYVSQEATVRTGLGTWKRSSTKLYTVTLLT